MTTDEMIMRALGQLEGKLDAQDEKIDRVLEDHEKRLRTGERFRNWLLGAIGLGGTGLAGALGIPTNQ